MPSFDHRSFLPRIQSAFPDVDVNQLKVNSDGLVNIVFIDGPRVFRFVREGWGVPLLRQELAVLELVQQHVNMPVPRYEVVADDFVTYTYVEGEPLYRHDIMRLPPAGQNALAKQLATFLRQLHSIPADKLTAADIHPGEHLQTHEAWLQFYEDVQRDLFPLMYRSTQTWVHEHFRFITDNPNALNFEPTLIHDDLAQYHILYQPSTQRINGIIDFGVANIGDPARDYATLLNIYGETFVRLMGLYDPRAAQLIDRARFYSGALQLQWVLSGVRSHNTDWFTAHLDRAFDWMPYGVPLG